VGLLAEEDADVLDFSAADECVFFLVVVEAAQQLACTAFLSCSCLLTIDKFDVEEQGVTHCHTVKLFHSRNMSFGPFSLQYKYFSESMEKLTNY
jgi:hypothetical protein